MVIRKRKNSIRPLVDHFPACYSLIYFRSSGRKRKNLCSPKFDADFENVYVFLLILTSSRFISEKLPILGPVPKNMQNRQFFAYKSGTSQDK